MSIPRRFPALTLAASVAASAALLLAACAGDDVDAPAADAATSSPSTPAAATTDTQDDATATASATASGDPVAPDDVIEPVEPVTGPADVTAELFYVPSPSERANACQIADGEVFCLFEGQELDPACIGDTPFALVTFLGDELTVACNEGGDASDAPAVAVGQVVSNPAGTYFCEGVEGGVKCTSSDTGTSALMTVTQAGLLN